MKVFVDIGAHFGQSILKALNPKFGFDLVRAFEPSMYAQKRLSRIKDPRLHVKPYALGGTRERRLLFGAGFLGASIFPDKANLVEPTQRETIEVRVAHEELEDLLIEENQVWLKINCEGSELAILRDLHKFDLLDKFEQIYIDWDARKVPSLRIDLADTISLVTESGCRYVSAHDFEETGWIGVEKWLVAGSDDRLSSDEISRQDFREYQLLKFPYSTLGFFKYHFPDLWSFLARWYHRKR